MIETLKLKAEKLPLSDTAAFSSTLLDYLDQHPRLQDLVGAYPSVESFESTIANRSFPQENRDRLVKVLNQQYSDLVLSEKLIKNITSLNKENCYTVTTGHQLNIYTGPLFFIYKIVSTIKACDVLKSHYPDYHFVPVYWMASEDHDFQEINHFNLFGETFRWECSQKGAVGHFELDGLADIADKIRGCPEFFKEAYRDSESLADATRKIANHLFGDYGLVVLDPDHKELKRSFSSVIKDELIQQSIVEKVSESSEKLNEYGYKTLVTPRKINLFYLTNGVRERIVENDAEWQVLNTDITFDKNQLLKELDDHPERFSPNVITRTLYQETILPNLAYIGGPGELSYWMQFKSSFEHYEIPFPILIPRNNALVINKGLVKKVQKLGLNAAELFLKPEDLKAAYVERNTEVTLDLNQEQDQVKQVFAKIVEKIRNIDGSLTGYLKAEENKVHKSLLQIEKRLRKAEEQNHEVSVNQLLSLKEKLFPDGNLQERHANFLSIYMNNPQFIDDLMEVFDPFDFQFYVLFENG